MKIKIEATLDAYSAKMNIGGTNKAVFKKSYKQELDPKLFAEIMNGYVRFHVENEERKDTIARIRRYDPATCTLYLEGNMASGTKAYMDKLASLGWKVDEEAVQIHNLPMEEADIIAWEKSLVRY